MRHSSHDMHTNSLWSWRHFDIAGRQHDVCGALERAGCPQTDRQVCGLLGSADMNYARPAITHLIHDGVLKEVGSVICPVTNRTVRTVWFAGDAMERRRKRPAGGTYEYRILRSEA